MSKFSYVYLESEPIEVEGELDYFILIDPLYASHIKDSGETVYLEISGEYSSIKKSLSDIDTKFFPHGGGLFGL